MAVCSFALGGVPFLSAFYSKDKIIEESFRHGLGFVFLLFLILSIFLTIIYRIRLVKFIVGEDYSLNMARVRDSYAMIWPISVLTLGAIFGGSFIR
jgi:NADH:ubiquinone oxidoreductase subunit 5 (subunit L)/multisubunit Na+/H+ antiporter MnhA subunit